MTHSISEPSILDADKPHFRLAAKTVAIATAVIIFVLAVDWVFRSATLPVEEVLLQGEFRNVSRESVEGRIYKYVTGNYLVMDLDSIKRDIESLPWVYSASVRRDWPSGLHISFVEQEPVIRWNDDSWLNKYGELVRFPEKQKPAIDYPAIKAPAGSESIVYRTYVGFERLLVENGFYIKQVEVSDRRSWMIVLENDITLLLGRDNIAARLNRFLDVYPVLNNEEGRLVRIDLRYTNGFSVTRLHPDTGVQPNKEYGSELKG